LCTTKKALPAESEPLKNKEPVSKKMHKSWGDLPGTEMETEKTGDHDVSKWQNCHFLKNLIDSAKS